MLHKISAFLLKLFGWEIVGQYPHHFDKAIILAGPHTSNWDFPIGIMVRSASRGNCTFIAKKTLFDSTFGFIFKWLDGIPVDQKGGQNFVQGVVETFNNLEKGHMVIAPEGTRKKVTKLRSGFFYMAEGVGMPMVPFIIDWEHKKAIFKEALYAEQGKEFVMKKLHELYGEVKGAVPQNGISMADYSPGKYSQNQTTGDGN